MTRTKPEFALAARPTAYEVDAVNEEGERSYARRG